MRTDPLPGIRVSRDGLRIAIWCAACRHVHGWLPINGGDPKHRWTWNEATLTLDPSVRHYHERPRDDPNQPAVQVTDCHYNVTNGVITYHADSGAHNVRGRHDLVQVPPPNYGGRQTFGWN